MKKIMINMIQIPQQMKLIKLKIIKIFPQIQIKSLKSKMYRIIKTNNAMSINKMMKNII